MAYAAGRRSGVVVVVPPASPFLTPPRALVRTVLRPHPLPHRLPLSPRAELASREQPPQLRRQDSGPPLHASELVGQSAGVSTQYPGEASRGERP